MKPHGKQILVVVASVTWLTLCGEPRRVAPVIVLTTLTVLDKRVATMVCHDKCSNLYIPQRVVQAALFRANT